MSPFAVTFRVRQRTHIAFAVDRQSTADGAWLQVARADGEVAANREAERLAAQFRERHRCEVALVLAMVPRRHPTRVRRPHQPEPCQGMTLRAEGFQTFIGRLG